MQDTSADLKNVVAIGASAGGVRAICDLIKERPAHLDAPIVIAVHSLPDSQLTEVLQAITPLPVKKVEDGDVLQNGCIHVVPGAKHVFFQNGALKLSQLVHDSGFRPSIDALFMTMAAEYGDRAVAVVLSGTLKDGMRGAQVIFDVGGRTIVQDPREAAFDGMPNSIIFNDHPEKVLPAADLGRWLTQELGETE
ncbi:Chemotaxis response regulator protein-glutamate methylesterase [Ascidiaceihabitans donghaensis]|uniref:protein-glutamate methylesterase n=1 Tax=Ascidiaceihabitans donghaensis TaxID=1510460 RepID=A0A2R8BF11_9RHOB|nr:chemotaxis protein CheB [Ascidiaceihabitans donghaensis]SPH21595.1 Chemotaxis response regulator protein-glutamate methylesterase [Ascidiaceihabitans donghaensis]